MSLFVQTSTPRLHERTNDNRAISVCGRLIKVQGRFIKIARLDAEKYLFLDDPEALLTGLHESGKRIDLFTFVQRLPGTAPRYRYPMEWDNLAAVPLSSFDDWWTQQINNKTRNMVRKSEKKRVIVREVPFDDVLIQGVWKVYNECPIRQGKPFVHYGKDVETVRQETQTYRDSSMFIGAFLDGTLIGFAKLTWDETRTQAALMNIVSMIEHRDKAPANALIAQAVRSCTERGFRYLVYESFPSSKKQHDNLSDFKQHNGFLRFDLPRYYIPLTRTGALAFRLGLHMRLIDHCPEVAIAALRELRNAWYERKLHSASSAQHE